MDFNEFKNSIDIIRIIETYLPLRKEGSLYKTNCPFHSEKTASFIINTQRKFWHCFGCNKGGDAIKFLQEYKHLSFTEAVQEAAKLENIEFSFKKDNQQIEFKFLNDLNEYFKNSLTQTAKDYLLKRGLNENDIYEFEIGYTSTAENFINFLKAKDYLKLALKLGYIKQTKHGLYSIFTNRLSFVIKDKFGRPRGFSTRELKKNNKLAKYINSNASDFFNKSFLMFNFDKAKEYARLTKSLYVAEGFFDIIALYKHGFKASIATCGTSFTLSHLSLIKSLNIEGLKLYFIPDKDAPGYQALIKSLKLCFENNIFNVYVLVCKKDLKDLGEFLQKYPSENLKENLHTYEGLEFFIKYHLQKEPTEEGKYNFFLKLKKLFESLENFYLKQSLIKKASFYLNINETAFLKATKQAKSTATEPQATERQLKQIIKTALIDSEFKERLIFYAKDDLKPYENFFNEPLSRALIVNESIEPYSKDKQTEALKAFILANLYKAKANAKDIKLINALSQQIAKIKKEI